METAATVTREQAVEIARSWKGTPYVLRGRVKGAGADCATFLLEYLVEIGAAPANAMLPLYTSDWFCHSSDQRYMRNLMKYAAQIAEGICRGAVDAQPGNLILFKHTHDSENYTHGAVVLKWPRVLHQEYSGVHETTATAHTLMAFRPYAVFDPFGSNA
jgi:cell wall-associated NlpC family hydrolase